MFFKRPTKFKDSENSKLSQCKFRYCRFMCKLNNQKIMSLEFIETKQIYIYIYIYTIDKFMKKKFYYRC